MGLEIGDRSFEEEVIKSNQPVLVDFWAPWCAPCRTVSPIIEKLANEYQGKFKFCKLNIDDNPKIAAEFHIISIPTILFFKDGRVEDTVIGAVPEGVIRPKIDRLLQPA